MRNKNAYTALLITLLVLFPLAASAQGDLLTHLEVAGSTISPNGDGYQDSLEITYTLADSAWSVSAYILTPDLPQTIVDILLFEAPRSAGNHSLTWDGRAFTGIPAPEGTYRLMVQAFNGAHDDSAFKTVFIDLTPPAVSITQVEPGIFAPDIVTNVPIMVVDFSVSNSPPENGDQMRVIIKDPDGKSIATPSPVPPFAGNGDYRVTWDGAEITIDGLYRIDIVVDDAGGFSGSDWSNLNVDKKAPALKVESPVSGEKFQTIPGSLSGWTWDRNGIKRDSIRISYSGEVKDFEPIASSYIAGDTVYFNAPLADSIIVEKQYTLLLKAQDVVGRETQISYKITLDTTAPSAPVLAQPDEPLVRKPSALLTGTVPDEPRVLRLYRNGVLADSLMDLIEPDVSHEVSLVPGANTFTALSVDDAGNTSPLSNAVTITFNNAAGLFIPQPFRPGNEFQINLTREARAIDIRIYDLSGNLVNLIEATSTQTSVSIPWDGLNGNDKSVERGPLVLVASISYLDGGKETQRELFLFTP